MRRASKIHKFEVQPDARFNNVLVTRFINALMIQGKKSVAERIFYGAVDMIEKKTGGDGLSVVKTALANVKPVLEVKSRRVGGATYQVPVEVRQDRRTAVLAHFHRDLIRRAAHAPGLHFEHRFHVGERR